MLEKFFKRPLHVSTLRNSRCGPLLEGFAKKLYQEGYARVTARNYIRVATLLIGQM